MSKPSLASAQSTRCCSEKLRSRSTPLAMFSAASNTESVENAQQLPQLPCERGGARYSFQLHAVADTEQVASPTIGSNGASTCSDPAPPSLGAPSAPSGVITLAPRSERWRRLGRKRVLA